MMSLSMRALWSSAALYAREVLPVFLRMKPADMSMPAWMGIRYLYRRRSLRSRSDQIHLKWTRRRSANGLHELQFPDLVKPILLRLESRPRTSHLPSQSLCRVTSKTQHGLTRRQLRMPHVAVQHTNEHVRSTRSCRTSTFV